MATECVSHVGWIESAIDRFPVIYMHRNIVASIVKIRYCKRKNHGNSVLYIEPYHTIIFNEKIRAAFHDILATA